MNGFYEGAMVTTLQECSNIDQLAAFVNEKWAWLIRDDEVQYFVVKYPWHTPFADTILYCGFNESFEPMFNEIKRGPNWSQNEVCDIKIVVHLYER